MRLILLLVIVLGAGAPALRGQKSIFGLHGILGVNASQINGDQLAGFDKVGVHTGLRGTARLGEKTGLSVELLYSERGSRPDLFDEFVDPDIRVTLQYLDVPVYFTYSDWPDAENGYDRAYAAAGFSAGRLINASTFDHYNEDDDNLDLLAREFNDYDVSWLIGFGFRLSRRFAISARYTRSISLLLNARRKDLNTNSLRVYFLSFRGEYVF